MLQPFTYEEKLFNSAQEKRGCQNVNRFGELTRHCYVPSSPPSVLLPMEWLILFHVKLASINRIRKNISPQEARLILFF